MKNKKTHQLPTLAFFLLLAGNAWATPISYSANFGLDVDIGSYTNDGGAIDANYSTLSLVTLPGFDSSLGTLNSVGISFTSEYGHGMIARAEDNRATCQDFFCLFTDIETAITAYNDVTLNAIFANAPGSTVSRTNTERESCSVSSDDGNEIFCVADDSPVSAGNFDGAFNLGGYSPADFVDVSQLFFGMQFQSTLYGACQNDLGDHCSILRGGIWNGTLTVLYDYTELVTDPNPDPHPVPTPAPLSLAAAGFLAWAVGGRRRPRDALRC